MDENRLQLILKTTEHYNRYIQQADRKASILLSGHLAFIALIMNLTTGGNRILGSVSSISFLLPAFLSVVSLFICLYAIYPRVISYSSNETTNGLGNLNWEAVNELAAEEYTSKVRSDKIDQGIESLSTSNKALANVLVRKHCALRVALASSLVTIAVTLGAALA
jgi:hypothetical protein